MKRKSILLTLILLIAPLFATAVEVGSTVKSLDGEVWYGAYTAKAFCGTPLDQIVFQPFPAEYGWKDLRKDNNSNQSAPLLISNMGRYIWSEFPFAFRFTDGDIEFVSDHGPLDADDAVLRSSLARA